MRSFTTRVLLFALSAAALAGCSKNPTIQIPPPPAPRLFVADNLNGLLAYNQPLSSTSMPSLTVASLAGAGGVTTDKSGNLYVSEAFTNQVFIYAPGFTATSTPIATVGPIVGAGQIIGITVDSNGGLYVADDLAGKVFYFAPPVGGTMPTTTMTSASFTQPAGVALDNAGHLLVANFGVQMNIVILSPPFLNGVNVATGVMTLPAQGVGIETSVSGNLLACMNDGRIGVIKPPFATGVTPSFYIPAPVINGAPANEAFDPTYDAVGNLYVPYGDHGGPNAGVGVFAPSFNASSVPTYTFSGGMTFPTGAAFAQ